MADHGNRQHGTLFWTAAAVAIGVLTGFLGLIGPWWSILLAAVSMIIFVRGPSRPRPWVDKTTELMAGKRPKVGTPRRAAETRTTRVAPVPRRSSVRSERRGDSSRLRSFFTDDTKIFQHQKIGYVGFRLIPLGLALLAAGWILQATVGSTPLLRFGVVLTLLSFASLLASDSEETIRRYGFKGWLTSADDRPSESSRFDEVSWMVVKVLFTLVCLLILLTAVLSALLAPHVQSLSLLIYVDVAGVVLLIGLFLLGLIGTGLLALWRKTVG